MTSRPLVALLLLTVAGPAAAHEVRPAYLEIREVEPATYDVLWKTPARGELRLALDVVLPGHCNDLAPPRMTAVSGAAIERRRTTCTGGLPGRTIRVDNLAGSLTDVILRFQPLDGAAKTLRLTNAAPAAVIPDRQPLSAIAGLYLRLGVEHILSGFDHLLFVLCLLMLVGNLKRLLVAVTAFTVAHSITLAGTTLGWVRLSITPVEACIALSIAFVAAEIIKAQDGRGAATARWPWIASFGFGLLHGFGFAAALQDIGLPEGAVPAALLFFNLGVEAGQVLVIGAALGFVAVWRHVVPVTPGWAWRAPVYTVGVIACYWFVERAGSVVA